MAGVRKRDNVGKSLAPTCRNSFAPHLDLACYPFQAINELCFVAVPESGALQFNRNLSAASNSSDKELTKSFAQISVDIIDIAKPVKSAIMRVFGIILQLTLP